MKCPFLGQKEDPATSYSYPTAYNYCNRAKPACSPKIFHQEAFCLADEYQTCPVFNRQQIGPLPPELRAPGSKPVFGVSQWKAVLVVFFIMSLTVISWKVFAQGLISTVLHERTATPGEIGVAQSSATFIGISSNPSETGSSNPTTSSTPTTTPQSTPIITLTVTTTNTPTTTSTAKGYLPYSSITPTSTFSSIGIVWTFTPTRTNTPTRTLTPTHSQTPTPSHTPTPTNSPTPTITLSPTDTNTPVPTVTNTLISTDTDTPVPTVINTLIPTDTDTLIPTDTDTP